VTAKGFSRYEQTDLQLLVNTPATANVRLKVGSVNESVTVTSEAPVLNLVDASIGNPFKRTQVETASSGRSQRSGVAEPASRSGLLPAIAPIF